MIDPNLYSFLSIDLAPILTALFSASACALLGNFLVLRRLSLMGDTISHSVLPGIVIAFLITGSRSSWPMFFGAALAGVFTSILVEVVRRLGRLETGAAMGVVFSVLFASGVLLLEQAAARTVDLDPDCLLHGQLEHIFWFPPDTWSAFLSPGTLKFLPREVVTSFFVFVTSIFFTVIFFKELKLSSFDEGLAKALGFYPERLHLILMVLVAAAVVASFEAVGSILVIGMLICPAATARLLTDRLSVQIWLSLLVTLLCTLLGYYAGAFGPQLFGAESSVNAAGSIVVITGIVLIVVVFLSPNYGILIRATRQLRLRIKITLEDVLGALYRAQEWDIEARKALELLYKASSAPLLVSVATYRARRKGLIQKRDGSYLLTTKGQEVARSLVRTHRLWESFLVAELGLRADHVHHRAMELEHYTSQAIAEGLAKTVPSETDPHKRRIPEKE